MKINPHPAPHIHYHENTRAIMGDMMLSMLVVYAMTYYYYGARVVILALVSMLSAGVAEFVCVLFRGKRYNFRDLSPLVTGMIIPLMMPASIPFYIVVVAAVFGIVVAKQPFGGTGQNVFNPAAAGIAFAILCFPTTLFQYPLPLETLPIFPENDIVLTNSPAFTLWLGGVPRYDWVEMSLGNFPGPMGATNILVVLACLLYLILRGTVRWHTPAAYLITFCALCWLFPRPGMERLDTLLYEVMSGTILFGGVFMLADPATTPQRGWSKLFYGAATAGVLLVFRRYSRLQEEFVFVLLLMNSCVWHFDLIGERLAGWIRKKTFPPA